MSEVKIKARGRISLAEKCPELIKEWDYDKNDKGPEEYSYASNEKVYWKCKLGHEYMTSIVNMQRGSSCPYCTDRKVLRGYNDLLTMKPEIASEWNQEKNNNLKSFDVTTKSSKKVWWRCKLGHEYPALVSCRVNGQGCPYCSSHKLLPGYNDLFTKNPILASEWNNEKNSKLTPFNVLCYSNKKVWWKCNLGHEWEAKINNRSKLKRGCPYCSGQKVLQGFNDLATLKPELANEWNTIKNSKLKASEVTLYSSKKVWWKCKAGHEWESIIYSRVNGNGCPICDSYKKTSVPEKIVYYYLKKIFHDAISGYRPAWLDGKEIDVYIPTIDFSYEYDGYWHSSTEAMKKDIEKNKIFSKLNKTIVRSRVPGLPKLKDNSICLEIKKISTDYLYMNDELKKIILLINNLNDLDIHLDINIERDLPEIRKLIEYGEKENSITKKNPKLLCEWDYDKNQNILPEYLSCGSSQKVWWRCLKCNYEWRASPYTRTKGHGCPECGKKKMIKTRIENKLKKIQYIEKTA